MLLTINEYSNISYLHSYAILTTKLKPHAPSRDSIRPLSINKYTRKNREKRGSDCVKNLRINIVWEIKWSEKRQWKGAEFEKSAYSNTSGNSAKIISERILGAGPRNRRVQLRLMISFDPKRKLSRENEIQIYLKPA